MLLLAPALTAGLVGVVVAGSSLQTPFKSLSSSGFPVNNPTRSFWINSEPDANPLAAEGSTGPLTAEADVCIIGSGITGVSTAYHLSKAEETKGLSIVIFEARDFCSGATGRNGGHLTPAVCPGFRSLESIYGTEQAARGFKLEDYTAQQLVSIIQEHNLTSAVDLVEGGHITLIESEEHEKSIRADYEGAKAAGLNLTNSWWIDRNAMSERYGTPYPAFHSPAWNLWPLKLVTQIYHIANKTTHRKLKLHTRTPVTAITASSSGSRDWTLHTPRGTTQCTYVVHATNAYASGLLPHVPITPTRGQIIAVRSNSSLEAVGKESWTNGGAEYWFPRPLKGSEQHPLIILGGGRGKYESDVSDDSKINESVGERLRAFLPSLFSRWFVRGREPEMEWTGIMGYTDVGDPFVGPVLSPLKTNYKGQFISAGYSGHGMPRTYACAEVVASLIASEVSGDPESWKAPEWLPERYLTWNRVL